MAAHRLPNYLKTYRKRAGLTQQEVAYLLGCASSAKASRAERLKRTPTLEDALAYNAIFRVPVVELFPGLFEKVERKVIRRIGILARRLHSGAPDKHTEQKLEALAAAVRGFRRDNERNRG